MLCSFYQVMTGQVEFLPYYLAKIDAEKRNQNLFFMADLVIFRCACWGWNLTDYYSSGLPHSERALVNAMIFLWNNMDESDKLRIVQENFMDFGRFVISFPRTEPLISAMKLYNASEENFEKVRRLLKKVAKKIQPTHKKYQKYWRLFNILFGRSRRG